MIKTIIKYFLVYALMLVSFMLFFSIIGYYLFVFDWGNSMLWSAINALMLLILICASIAIYYFAEKIKLLL